MIADFVDSIFLVDSSSPLTHNFIFTTKNKNQFSIPLKPQTNFSLPPSTLSHQALPFIRIIFLAFKR